MNIACAARGPYVAHSAAMIRSALVACPGAVTVHFLHGTDLRRSDRWRLLRMVEHLSGSIEFHEVDVDRLQSLPSPPQFTVAMWYRILLPELLPEIDRVLYLDIDTLALDDLSPLFALDLGEAQLAAVENIFLKRRHEERVIAMGLGGAHGYFNSGVLLLDLDAMRRRGAVEDLLDVVAERGDELEWPDQDALNLVLGAGRVRLAPRWNCMNSVMHFAYAGDVLGADPVAEARARPAIRHFEGPDENKPWHLLSAQAHRAEYFHHRRRTPWPLVRRTGLSRRNLVRLLRDGRQPFTASRPV